VKQRCRIAAAAAQLAMWMALPAGAQTNATGAAPAAAPTNVVSTADWMTDYYAALTLAREKGLPILLSFAGKGWCLPCEHMDANVFVAPEWTAFATGRFVRIRVNMTKEPRDMTEQARRLAIRFGVQGVPSFFILDSNGTNILGQTGFQPEPYAFIRETSVILRRRIQEREAFLRTLAPEDRETYTRLNEEKEKAIREFDALMAASPEPTAATRQALNGCEDRITGAEAAIREIEIRHGFSVFLGADAAKGAVRRKAALDYVDALRDLAAAQAAADSWLLSRPADTPANARTFAGLNARLDAALVRVRAMK
jgi:thioredoxin-related protein